MKKLPLVILLLTIPILFSCEKGESGYIDPIPPNYKDWEKPVGLLEYPVPGHGESRRLIYVNRIALTGGIRQGADGRKFVIYPKGTIIIKEVYRKTENGYAKKPQLTIMVKDPGNEAARYGWLYYVKNADQASVTLVENKLCEGCHDAANERHPYFDQNKEGMFRDYVFINLAKPE